MNQAMTASSPWLDSPVRYGIVSRLLHWLMAALLLWQFAGMIVKELVGRSALTSFMIGSHKPLGTLLLVLAVVRVIWALSQWRNRPRHPRTLLGRAAGLGHAALYALMLYVPGVALLRAYGDDKPFAPWGIPLFAGNPAKVEWMIAPASATHGLLAWLFLAAIAGHVVMAVVHQRWLRDQTLSRMVGRL